jgi:hypothetical protein
VEYKQPTELVVSKTTTSSKFLPAFIQQDPLDTFLEKEKGLIPRDKKSNL